MFILPNESHFSIKFIFNQRRVRLMVNATCYRHILFLKFLSLIVDDSLHASLLFVLRQHTHAPVWFEFMTWIPIDLAWHSWLLAQWFNSLFSAKILATHLSHTTNVIHKCYSRIYCFAMNHPTYGADDNGRTFTQSGTSCTPWVGLVQRVHIILILFRNPTFKSSSWLVSTDLIFVISV